MHLCLACMQDKGENGICPYCGFNEADMTKTAGVFLPMGFVLNQRYVIGKALGQGGFGITYIGFDRVLNIRVAVKEYYPSNFAQRLPENVTVLPFTQNEEEYQKGKERFLEEARTLAKFSDHPGIVGVKDCFASNETAYMVMEYLDGMNLKEYLEAKGGRLPVSASLSILIPVMDALRAVHQEGMIHRDISPDNIFITKNGQVKLIDFGAARHSIGGERSLSVMLKPGYAPEEQYRTHGNQGPWTDVYALTATLYRMITGEVPPDALERVMEDKLVISPELPEAVQMVFRRGLAVRAQDRFSSVVEMQQTLRGETMAFDTNLHAGQTISVQKRTKGPHTGKEKSSRRVIIWSAGIAGVICLLLIVFTFFMLMQNQNIDTQTAGEQEIYTAQPALTEAPSAVPAAAPVETSVPSNTPTAVVTEAPLPTEAEVVYDHTADMRLLEDAVYNCLYGFTYAVNTGDTSEVASFVDEGTAYYDETIKNIGHFHEQGIQEEVLSYAIVDVEWLDQNRCNLTQHSVIRVDYVSGESKEIEETYTYLLRRSGDKFLYTKMYE